MRVRRQVEAILNAQKQMGGIDDNGMLYLLAYAFLLRLPSEALPAVAGKSGGQSSLYREGETLVLELRRRKNKPNGSKLVRGCWCKQSQVHGSVACTWVV